MNLYCTIKAKGKAFKLGYVLTNPYKDFDDMLKVYVSEEAACSRFNTLDDYHGTKAAARQDGQELLDAAIEQKTVDPKNETEINKLLTTFDIKVSHQISGASNPSVCDRATAKEKFKKLCPEMEKALSKLAKKINYDVPEKWTEYDIASLRCAKRAYNRLQAKQNLLNDF